MATLNTTTTGNIFDVLKMKLPNGSAVDFVVNALAEQDDFSRFVPAFPANNGMTSHGVRTIQLPSGFIVDVGGSWKSSKAIHEPFVEGLMTVRSTYEAPVDTFTQEKQEVGEALLRANRTAHVMSLNQATGKAILGGGDDNTGTTPNPKANGLIGLMDRDPYLTHDSKFCFSVGGSGTDLRSCWLIKPGIDTMHTLYNPNHPTLGIEEDFKGEEREDGLGTGKDEHRYNIVYEYLITKGIMIRDQRAVKRICNVDCGTTALPGNDLIEQILYAKIVNAPTGGSMTQNANGVVTEIPSNWILLCDEWLYAKLVVEANNKLMVHTSNKNIYKTDLPMIGTDIVIARWDALNKVIGSGEAAVSAAS